MNVLHMKYAVEVAKAGSINRASEALLIAQPNLSRSIKDLEADLGITIFDRSSRGMILTPEGEEFVRYAQKVLSQIDEIEQLFRSRCPARQHFSLAFPRAQYVAHALARFSRRVGETPIELLGEETDFSAGISAVMSGSHKLGIVRLSLNRCAQYRKLWEEKKLTAEPLVNFHPLLTVNRACPLARAQRVMKADLSSYIEIAPAENDVSSERRLLVSGCESQLAVLAENPQAFLWSSPLTEEALARYALAQRPADDGPEACCDILIRARDYTLTALDQAFLSELHAVIRTTFPAWDDLSSNRPCY